jgi:rSAM/selenodomain-associated transferase 1
MSDRPILVVFLKYPEPGKVKTRLAAEMGAQAAADLYRDWIGIVLGNLQALRPSVRVVGLFDGAAEAQFAVWNSLIDEWVAQAGGDLGERLSAAFGWGHSRGGPVLAIGTDCLELNREQIEEAIHRLADADAVFGPAADGGYYLVGMKRHVPDVFTGIRWSSPHTLHDQLHRCEELGLRPSLSPQLADIDTLADWRAYLLRRDTP